MEQIAYKTIAQAAQESVDYIKARREHTIVPLKTRWKKFNKVCCGGLEPNMILTIAGISGTGKFCRLYEESYKSLRSNIGVGCDVDTEITVETKESTAS